MTRGAPPPADTRDYDANRVSKSVADLWEIWPLAPNALSRCAVAIVELAPVAGQLAIDHRASNEMTWRAIIWFSLVLIT